MLDDDFRMLMRPGEGCACKLHMAEFQRRTGKKWSREEMWAHIDSHPDDVPLTLEFIQMQTDTLVNAAKIFREGIDEVDPKIQGINCTSGDQCDSVVYTNPHFCGKGNPTMVRVPCGTYAPKSVREFSDIMRRAATCVARLCRGGIEIILGETDTIPFNRYGKNARYLHSHYTAAILEDCIVKDMTDGQINDAFAGSVFVTSEAADDLIDRGYGDLLGVTVKDWEGVRATGEYFAFDPSASCTAQKNRRMIVPTNEKVEVLSYSYRPIDGNKTPLSPAVTLLDRGEGRISVVFAGTPDAEHTYTEGFAFLNESRKRQFVDVLSRAGVLPIYYDGDEEVLLRAGKIRDGRLLAHFLNLGYDPLCELDLVLDFEPTEIAYLNPDGKEIALDFVLGTDGGVKVMCELLPMYPLVLLIK